MPPQNNAWSTRASLAVDILCITVRVYLLRRCTVDAERSSVAACSVTPASLLATTEQTPITVQEHLVRLARSRYVNAGEHALAANYLQAQVQNQPPDMTNKWCRYLVSSRLNNLGIMGTRDAAAGRVLAGGRSLGFCRVNAPARASPPSLPNAKALIAGRFRGRRAVPTRNALAERTGHAGTLAVLRAEQTLANERLVANYLTFSFLVDERLGRTPGRRCDMMGLRNTCLNHQ